VKGSEERREMITTKYTLNKPLKILSIIRDAQDLKRETGLVLVEDEFGNRSQVLAYALQPEEEVEQRLDELRNNESQP